MSDDADVDTDGPDAPAPDVETYVDRAIRRVDRERDRLADKREAFQRFDAAVESVAADAPAVPSGGVGSGATTGVGPGSTRSGTGGRDGDDSLRAVRRAFREHVAPHGGDAEESFETVDEAIAGELSTEVAAALAAGGGTAGGFPPQLKRAVRSETDRRLRELAVTTRALERERASLVDAGETVTTVVGWFTRTDDVPLDELDFPALAARHDRIDGLRGRLDDLADRRGAHVHASTGTDGTVGIDHRVLAEYLYAGFEPTYPVLATVARLGDICDRAQRALRDHLVRRV